MFFSDELLAAYAVTFDGRQLSIAVPGLSESVAPLRPQAPDIFETAGLPVKFKRDDAGQVSGLALAPNQLHALAFAKSAGDRWRRTSPRFPVSKRMRMGYSSAGFLRSVP